MNKNPLVSFIIPFFNSGATIQETINSILLQSYENFDVWIVNDGCTDAKSLEILKDLEKDVRINVLHQENAGPSVARNRAIKISDADFFVPLDADDLILKDTINNCLSEFDKNERIGVVFGDLAYFGAKNYIKSQSEFILQKQLLWNQVAVCCLIKKDVFETVGYYDEDLSMLGLEDWEFWLRVGASHWEFKKQNSIHFKIRITDSSRTFEVANKNLDEIKRIVCQKNAELWLKSYEDIFYQKKMLLEGREYRIGSIILKPFKFIIQLFKR